MLMHRSYQGSLAHAHCIVSGVRRYNRNSLIDLTARCPGQRSSCGTYSPHGVSDPAQAGAT